MGFTLMLNWLRQTVSPLRKVQTTINGASVIATVTEEKDGRVRVSYEIPGRYKEYREIWVKSESCTDVPP